MNKLLHRTRFAAPLLFSFLLIPTASAHAATLLSAQNVDIASSTPDNTYLFGGQVRVDSPLPADLCAAAATLTVAAPVTGEALLAGGTVDVQRPVASDLRAIGGRINVDDSVGGDLLLGGGVISVYGKPKNAYILGGTVTMAGGADGPVTIYGADVTLSGTYAGDVMVVASDNVTVNPGTVIHGSFRYNAPVQASIPASAQVMGGVNYIGQAGWLPTTKQAETFATAGIWIFWLVRLTAAVVAAGLIAGLFPVLADRVVEATLRRTTERFVLFTLLGFAGFIATPVLILFLSISFVGIGVALLLLSAYVLFLLLACIYAGIVTGAMVMRFFKKRFVVSWRVAILGVVVLSVIGSLPYVGFMIALVLAAASGGALLSIMYRFAFRREPLDITTL